MSQTQKLLGHVHHDTVICWSCLGQLGYLWQLACSVCILHTLLVWRMFELGLNTNAHKSWPRTLKKTDNFETKTFSSFGLSGIIKGCRRVRGLGHASSKKMQVSFLKVARNAENAMFFLWEFCCLEWVCSWKNQKLLWKKKNLMD